MVSRGLNELPCSMVPYPHVLRSYSVNPRVKLAPGVGANTPKLAWPDTTQGPLQWLFGQHSHSPNSRAEQLKMSVQGEEPHRGGG